MLVKELVEALQKMPQDLEVITDRTRDIPNAFLKVNNILYSEDLGILTLVHDTPKDGFWYDPDLYYAPDLVTKNQDARDKENPCQK